MKLLVVHGSDSNLSSLVGKVSKLNAKAGPFSHIFLLGDFEEETVNELKELEDLPTLYILGCSGENTTDIIRFNGSGVYECQDKLIVGYSTQTSKELQESRKKLTSQFKQLERPVDIFISREWSSDIASLNDVFSGTNLLNGIVKMAQPKYHIAYGDSNHYFESKPFIWEESSQISRFINIADFDSSNKWAYAFNLDPTEIEELEESKKKDIIENPYERKQEKRPLPENSESNATNHDDQSKLKKARKILPNTCHFCFTNSSLQDHMIISIGKSSYMTVAKGPLTVPKFDMSFSGHCLLIPIEHISKYNIGQENFSQSDLVQEMTSYEKSVVKMNYRKFDMSTIIFEINSERSIHFHKQLMPIPKYLIMKFQAALDRQLHYNNEKFYNNAKLNFEKYSPEDDDYLKIRNDPKSNYLQFTIYETSEALPQIYIAMFQPDMRIDLQFGRRVVAFMLKLPKRIKWDSPACQQTKEQETKETENFQKSYKEFDIANQ